MKVRAALKTIDDILCPFCKDGIRNALACTCNSCHTLSHDECFRTAGKCSVFGCVSRLATPKNKQEVDDYYQEILSESSWKFLGQTLLSFLWFIVFVWWSMNVLENLCHSWKEYELMSFFPILGLIGMGYNLYLRAKRILMS